jgi:hypothetical protein
MSPRCLLAGLALCAAGCPEPARPVESPDLARPAVDLAMFISKVDLASSPFDMAMLPDLVGTCGDGVRDGTETDVDCGGGGCPVCSDGARCSVAGDCASGDCSGNVCVSCSDGKRNGGETDVDCGGPLCPGCAAGGRCLVPADCMSGECAAMVCGAAADGAIGDGGTD